MSDAIPVKLVSSRVGVRNAFARMPFRFGVITMRASPLATLEVEIEAAGRRAKGWAADFLAYRWFDKRPEKTLAENCADLLRTVDVARRLYAEAGAAPPAELWRATYSEIERIALAEGFNRLGASFGSSMLERGVLDALGRLTGKTYFELVRDDLLGIVLGKTFPELAGRRVGEFLPARPLERLHLRHTVGLVDPITTAEIRPEDRVGDGLPQSLEEYLDIDGIAYLKIKVGGDLEADLARLEAIAAAMFARDRRYRVSLDGNEQYKDLGDFLALVEAIRSRPKLARLHESIAFIEQPLDRRVALEAKLQPALAELSREKPVIIDEADGWVTAFAEAMELGYRGTSHKNCKGIYKSLHNRALASTRSQARGRPGHYFLSAEDLTNVPVVPLQADLASVALLGIDHVERNGHHYLTGMRHLTEAAAEAALRRHPDLYARHGRDVVLRIAGGDIDVGSLQVPGMGFVDPPDMAAMVPAAEWRFESLGLDEGQALAR